MVGALRTRRQTRLEIAVGESVWMGLLRCSLLKATAGRRAGTLQMRIGRPSSHGPVQWNTPKNYITNIAYTYLVWREISIGD